VAASSSENCCSGVGCGGCGGTSPCELSAGGGGLDGGGCFGGWISLMLGFFWWHSDHVVDFVPVVSGIASASMLIALYLPGVSRWLGVQPPPQPF